MWGLWAPNRLKLEAAASTPAGGVRGLLLFWTKWLPPRVLPFTVYSVWLRLCLKFGNEKPCRNQASHPTFPHSLLTLIFHHLSSRREIKKDSFKERECFLEHLKQTQRLRANFLKMTWQLVNFVFCPQQGSKLDRRRQVNWNVPLACKLLGQR